MIIRTLSECLALFLGLGTLVVGRLSLIHISEPTRQAEISYAVFCFLPNKMMMMMIIRTLSECLALFLGLGTLVVGRCGGGDDGQILGDLGAAPGPGCLPPPFPLDDDLACAES